MQPAADFKITHEKSMRPAGASRVLWDFEPMGHSKALPADGKTQTESWQSGSGKISHIAP